MSVRSRESNLWPALALLSLGVAVSAHFRDFGPPVSAAPPPPMIAEDVYFGIRPGMMIPYFGTGDAPPKGYVFADGKATWPPAAWVPKNLHGKPVPDTSGVLVGGAADESEVGTRYAGGGVTIPRMTVEGASFSVPPAKEVRLQGEVDRGKHGNPSPNAWMILMENFEGAGGFKERKYPYVEWNHAADRGGWFHRVNLRPLNIPVVAGKIVGQQVFPERKIDLKEHGPFVKCRWIIRVE